MARMGRDASPHLQISERRCARGKAAEQCSRIAKKEGCHARPKVCSWPVAAIVRVLCE